MKASKYRKGDIVSLVSDPGIKYEVRKIKEGPYQFFYDISSGDYIIKDVQEIDLDIVAENE